MLVGHPFDLVKVRQQTEAKSKDKHTKGTIATLKEIAGKEGFAGLYRGVSAPMLAVAPIFAVSFWGFDTGDKLVRALLSVKTGANLNLMQLCLAGGFSALPTAIIMVPSERIKCLLQTQTKKYNAGFRDCASRVVEEEGLLGLYKGTTLTLLRDVPGNMIYFGVYEWAKRALSNNSNNALLNPAAAAFVAGALAGVAFWPFVLPMDCLKSRYQTAPDGTYTNIAQVYNHLVEEEGIGGMFRGIGPAMMRSAPANALSFLGAEMTKVAISKFF